MARPDTTAPLAARTFRNSTRNPTPNAGAATPQRPRATQPNPPYTPPAHHHQHNGKLHRQKAQLSGYVSNAMRNEMIAFLAEFCGKSTNTLSDSFTSLILPRHIHVPLHRFVHTCLESSSSTWLTVSTFIAFVGTQVANEAAASTGNAQDTHHGLAQAPNANTLQYIALSFGFSLAINVWIFFRISGGLYVLTLRRSNEQPH